MGEGSSIKIVRCDLGGFVNWSLGFKKTCPGRVLSQGVDEVDRQTTESHAAEVGLGVFFPRFFWTPER